MRGQHEFPRVLRLAAFALCVFATTGTGGANGSQYGRLEEAIGVAQDDLDRCVALGNCSNVEERQLAQHIARLFQIKARLGDGR